MLHPSRPWVPLFRRGIWTPMSCGSWVPLVTERHHGLSRSPVQREWTMAPGPRALLVMSRRSTETAGLTPVGVMIPVTPLPPTSHHRHPNGWELIVIVQYAALVLRMTAGAALVPFAFRLLLLPMPAVAAASLPSTPNVVGPETVLLSPIILHWPAGLGDLLRRRPCHPGAVLPRTRRGDHPGAVVRPLSPGGCPLIAAAATPLLGHPHLDVVAVEVPALAVHAPGLLTGIVSNICMRQTSIF